MMGTSSRGNVKIVDVTKISNNFEYEKYQLYKEKNANIEKTVNFKSKVLFRFLRHTFVEFTRLL